MFPFRVDGSPIDRKDSWNHAADAYRNSSAVGTNNWRSEYMVDAELINHLHLYQSSFDWMIEIHCHFIQLADGFRSKRVNYQHFLSVQRSPLGRHILVSHCDQSSNHYQREDGDWNLY